MLVVGGVVVIVVYIDGMIMVLGIVMVLVVVFFWVCVNLLI